ncbi:hypothetical protein [Paenibacillus sp. GYB003]|uniref:hypothetical protein n=1 Tax=Paenibacillus sp. GYB003 TaxID=2994392 RepID=UPI002F9658B4
MDVRTRSYLFFPFDGPLLPERVDKTNEMGESDVFRFFDGRAGRGYPFDEFVRALLRSIDEKSCISAPRILRTGEQMQIRPFIQA